jgi:putative PEP-CTERM system TPR-repeat lipoprotein
MNTTPFGEILMIGNQWNAALLSGLIALTLTGCVGKSSDELIATAKQHRAEGRPKSAVIELKNALQADPKSAEARFQLGLVLLDSGDVAGAEIELERALALKYSEPMVAPPLARAMLAQKKYDEVVSRFKSMRFEDPKLAAEVETLVGEALLGDQRFADAGQSASLAQRHLTGYGPALRLQARVMAASGKSLDAVQLLETHVASAPQDAESWRLLGELTLVARGDRQAAMRAFKAAADARPEMIEAYETMIALHFLENDLDAAQRALDAARKAKPNDPRVHYFDAQLAFARGDYAATRELLAPLLMASSTDLNLLRLAGATELKLGALSKAEHNLNLALSRAPEVLELRRLLGEVYIRLGQGPKALEVLAPALTPTSPDADALALGGQAAMLVGDKARSLQYFERALKLRPDDAVLRASASVARLAAGQGVPALADLRRIAAGDKGTAVDMALITALWQRRDFSAALTAVDALEAKQPDSPIGANLRGQIQLRQKALVEARKSFELALSRDPEFVPAALLLADLDLMDDQPDAARGRIEAIIKRDSRNMMAHLALVNLVQRIGGDKDEVISLLQAAVAADTTAEAPRLTLVDFLLAGGEFKAAVASAQSAVAALPLSTELPFKLGQAQLLAGELRQAIGSFGSLTQQRPDLIRGHLGHAEALFAAKEYDAAWRSLQRAAEIDANSVVVRRMQVAVALAQKRPEPALEAARKVIAQRPSDAEGYSLKGDVELSHKNLAAAIASYRKATTLFGPGSASIKLHRTLLRAKKSTDAIQFADSWVDSHAKDVAFAMYLGDSALANGDLPSAERRYRRVLAQQPQHSMALNNLAWLLASQNKSGAVAMARQAVALAPGQATYLDTLATALSREKEHREAIEVIKKVVANNPDQAAYRLNLARIHLNAGDKSSARDELEQLERLGRGFSGQDEVKRLQRMASDS